MFPGRRAAAPLPSAPVTGPPQQPLRRTNRAAGHRYPLSARAVPCLDAPVRETTISCWSRSEQEHPGPHNGVAAQRLGAVCSPRRCWRRRWTQAAAYQEPCAFNAYRGCLSVLARATILSKRRECSSPSHVIVLANVASKNPSDPSLLHLARSIY